MKKERKYLKEKSYWTKVNGYFTYIYRKIRVKPLHIWYQDEFVKFAYHCDFFFTSLI
jgi:hypothetical protein